MDEIFDDRYKLIRVLGQGGMANVYEAEQMSTARTVALKVLNSQSLDEQSIARFKREAHVLTSLSHPNILNVYAFGVADNKLYMCLELLPGSSMQDKLAEVGHLSWAQILDIMKQLCAGVQFAHDCGVIHRDLKPANIMLLPTGDRFSVKIVDFGVSRFTTSSAAQKLTATGSIIGTPNYMSPEQWRGQPADEQADVYALGCILYELCCGKKAVDGQSMAEMVANAESAAVLPFRPLDRSTPQKVETVLRKALMSDRKQRYASVSQLSADLELVASGGNINSAAWPSSRKKFTGVAAVVLSAGALALLLLHINANQPNRSKQWEQLERAKKSEPAKQSRPITEKELARQNEQLQVEKQLALYAGDTRFPREQPPSRKFHTSAVKEELEFLEQCPRLDKSEAADLLKHRYDATLFMRLAELYETRGDIDGALAMFAKSQQEISEAINIAGTRFKHLPMVELQLRTRIAYWLITSLAWTDDKRLRQATFEKAQQHFTAADKLNLPTYYHGWLRMLEGDLHVSIAEDGEPKHHLKIALGKYEQSIKIYVDCQLDCPDQRLRRQSVIDKLKELPR